MGMEQPKKEVKLPKVDAAADFISVSTCVFTK